MAENLLQELNRAITEINDKIEESRNSLFSALSEYVQDLSEGQDTSHNLLYERLDRIEAFLGMPKDEPSKNGSKESEESKHKKAPKGPFRIKAWDGTDAFWYGGKDKRGNKPMWRKSPKLAKKFKSLNKAQEIVSKFGEGYEDNCTIEEVS